MLLQGPGVKQQTVLDVYYYLVIIGVAMLFL